MKIKNLFIALTIVSLVLLSGCQWTAKNFGGSYTVDLPDNRKLVNLTWKDSELWILTKEMNDEDIAETYKLQEDSTFGLLEGVVTINENKGDE